MNRRDSFPRQPSERTDVSRESEVWTPTLTAVVGALSGDIFILALFLIIDICVGWYHMSFMAAWLFIVQWWPLLLIFLLLAWLAYPALLALAFALQTINKHGPPTMKATRVEETGVMWFLAHRRRKQEEKRAREDRIAAAKEAGFELGSGDK